MIFRIFFGKRKKTYMSKVKPFILDPVDSLAKGQLISECPF